SCQTHTLRGIHGREHILGKFFKLRIEFSNWRSRLFKDGVAILDDRINFARLRNGLCRFDLRYRWFRTWQFARHNYRNSAASRRESLLQIFAEKHQPAQERSSLRRPRPLPEPRTSQNVRKRLVPAAW